MILEPPMKIQKAADENENRKPKMKTENHTHHLESIKQITTKPSPLKKINEL